MPHEVDEKTNLPEGVPVRQLGSTGLQHSAGWLLEEFHPKLRGKRAIKTFRQMKDNEAVLGSYLFKTRALIRSTPWEIEAAGESPQELMAKEFVESVWDDMSHTREEFIDEVLAMLWAGYQMSEIVPKLRLGDGGAPWTKSKHHDGRVGIRKLAPRAQETIERWELDADGGIAGAWQRDPSATMRSDVLIPIDRALLFRTMNLKNNPEGYSMFRPAYRSWWLKTRIEEFEAIGIEKDMAGVLVLRAPLEYFLANATSNQKTQVAEYRKLVERSRRNEFEGFVFPAKVQNGEETGFDLETITGGGRKPMDTDPIVRRLEQRMLISVLGEHALLGMESAGSWALASSKTKVEALAIESFMVAIGSVLDRFLYPRLMLMNGWPESIAPKTVFADIEEDSIESINAANTSVQSGTLTAGDTVERWIRTRLGIPEDEQPSMGQMADAFGSMRERDAAGEEDAAAQELLRGEVPIEGDDQPLDRLDPKADENRPVRAQVPDVTMTEEEAAEFLKVSRAVIRNAIKSGRLPGAVVGRSVRIRHSDLMEFMRGGIGAKAG